MVGRNTGRGDFAWHISGRAECGVFPGSDLLRIDLLRREIVIVCLLLDVLDDRGWSSVGKNTKNLSGYAGGKPTEKERRCKRSLGASPGLR